MENSRFIVSSVFEYQLHKPPNLGIITPEPVIDPAQIRILIQHFLAIVQKLVNDLPLRYIPKLATGNSRYPQTKSIIMILLQDIPRHLAHLQVIKINRLLAAVGYIDHGIAILRGLDISQAKGGTTRSHRCGYLLLCHSTVRSGNEIKPLIEE